MSEQTAENDAPLSRAIRTLLPGLHLANYVERWSPQSPAVRALTILSEYVGYDPVVPGDLLDPDVPTAHECRPEGRVMRYFIDRTEVTEAYAREVESRGAARVVAGVRAWCAINEIAEPPLDWEGLGEFLTRTTTPPEPHGGTQ